MSTRTIHKHVLPYGAAEVCIPLPRDAKVIDVGLDRSGAACVWTELDPDAPASLIPFYVVPTGGELPRHFCEHVGSFMYRDSGYVGHVYMRSAR